MLTQKTSGFNLSRSMIFYFKKFRKFKMNWLIPFIKINSWLSSMSSKTEIQNNQIKVNGYGNIVITSYWNSTNPYHRIMPICKAREITLTQVKVNTVK
jgi:hypothetical protein